MEDTVLGRLVCNRIAIPMFTYLDTDDFKNTNAVNWRLVRLEKKCPEYSWCTESKISVVYNIFNKLQYKKVNPTVMTDEEIHKEVFTERLKGGS